MFRLLNFAIKTRMKKCIVSKPENRKSKKLDIIKERKITSGQLEKGSYREDILWS